MIDTPRLRDAFSNPGPNMPAEEIAWARNHWNEARPVLLAMLTACAKPGDITEREADAAFLALHVLAAQRETGALAIVCALARNGDRLEFILGDALTDHFPRLLAGLGEEANPLASIIAEPACDEVVRAAFLVVWRRLFCLGRVSREEAWQFLIELAKSRSDPDEGFFADEWAQTLIAVDPDAGLDLVEQEIASGWVDPHLTHPDDYRALARDTKADPDGQRNTFLVETAPVDDIIGLMERWMSAPDAASSETDDEPSIEREDETVHNPLRAVGRNDPCPCGSGRKFKKCCLPKAGFVSAS